ncbi:MULTISPECIES: tyrosine-type recombinase/integrase [unclassified Leucobacter]|uniref:tyrosine-type recombinase/integrase n=1 Tax=unclassified Leucobacter TaxID=2621730 RepID=UPI00301AF289
MGSIHRYENAKGETLYRIAYRRPDNKQTNERGFKRKRDAEKRLAEVEVSKHRGEFIAPSDGRALVADLGKEWLESKKGVLKPTSYAPLEASWRNYVKKKWGARTIASIRHSEVQSWVSGIDMSPTVVIRAYGILASILDAAVRDRRVARNVARDVTLPRKVSKKSRRYLSHEELWRVAESAGDHKTLVLTLGYCGLRWGELVALRVADIDFARRRINVTRSVSQVGKEFHEGTPKTYETRSVPVPTEVAKLVKERCEGKKSKDLVFDDGHGGYQRRVHSSEKERSWWNTALSTAGVERLVLHDLRHTAASLAVSAGANVKAVQRMLGHASAAMTLDVYADLFDDDLEAVSERLDLAIASRGVVKVLSRDDS